MPSRVAILVPCFLVAQAGLTFWAAAGERPPQPPEFSRFPIALGDWRKTADDPVSADTLAQLGADKTLSLLYSGSPLANPSPAGQTVARQEWLGSLFVAWFQSQRGGASQPHSPQVCLPAAGWIPAVSDRIAMNTAAGAVSVNRYIATLGSDRVVVLYWYQTGARVIASEWAAKFWVIADRLKDHRTDTSLVRVVVWNSGRSDNLTTDAALTLAERTYPALSRLYAR